MKIKGLITLVLFILVAESVLTGLIPHARGYLFGFLESKSGPVYIALALYFSNYLSLDFFQAIKRYFIVKLSLMFRTNRSNETIKCLGTELDNEEQRIQEDIKLSYVSRITVYAEYFISGTIVLQLILINLDAPVLSLAALAYAGLSVYIAIKFNPRLTRAEKEVQKTEASFRADIAASKSLSLLPGANKASMMAEAVHMQYLLFTKLQLGFMAVLPYIVLVPSLMAGDISLGELMKHQATFSLIVVNAAILIQYYTLLVKGRASEERVRELEDK